MDQIDVLSGIGCRCHKVTTTRRIYQIERRTNCTPYTSEEKQGYHYQDKMVENNLMKFLERNHVVTTNDLFWPESAKSAYQTYNNQKNSAPCRTLQKNKKPKMSLFTNAILNVLWTSTPGSSMDCCWWRFNISRVSTNLNDHALEDSGHT